MIKRVIKSKDLQLLKRFSRYFFPYKKWVIISFCSIPVTTFAGILFLWLVERIIDDFIIPGDVTGLKLYSFMLAAVLVVNFLFDGIYSYSFSKAGGLAIVDMRKELFGKSLRFPMRYFDKNPIGVTLSRLTSDMEAIAESFAAGILGLLADSFKTAALVSYLFYLNWRLTLVLLLVVPFIVIVIKFLRKKIRAAFNQSRTSLAKSAAYLQESLNGVKTIRLYGADREAWNKYDTLNREYSNAQNRSNVYDAALYSVVEGITSVATALILWYGAVQIWEYDYSIGVLIVFVITLSRLFIPVRQFAQQISTIQRAMSALEHISSLFEEKIEDDEKRREYRSTATIDDIKEIEFKNVSFAYNKGEDVLKNISFTMKRGDRIALVGSTGSGKSTILRLLTCAYSGYRGSITINGVELSHIPINHVRSLGALMQQDIFMFNESVAFNIGLGRENISEQDIEDAARFVYADRFIKELPGGYSYKVQDNGDNLSRGQAQLISFARAICDNRELIILDEATSSVDSVTENYIQKAIENILSSRTVIAVAHRLSTIKRSDLIIVLENGEIIERGSHSELISYDGKYAGLVSSLKNRQE
ncbi:ABC transporter ATP-binding protein [Marinilabiliaceae bacterium ANBcel2]|nr:ABC transporter ATP-binding protein [Marinilabiliaceae bacterium ANBcel2]